MEDGILRIFSIKGLIDSFNYISREHEVLIIKDRCSWVAVHAETQQPFTNFALVFLIGCLDIPSLPINLNQLFVILNDSLIWLRVVVDAPIAD